MAKVSFTVSARTAMLIGLENFSNPEGAIVELVKNAYDADSPYCYILFDILDSGERCLYIIDSGCGMTMQTIETCWMRIGTDDKLLNAYSSSGRIKSGAKGIGRFALNRLGKQAQMLTRKADNPALLWSVDWSAFTVPGINVNDITAEIEEIPIKSINEELVQINTRFNVNIPSFTTGTILKVIGLSDEWSDNQLEHLFNSLQDVIPPFNVPKFKIIMHVQGSNEYGVVDIVPYDDYDYKVSANYGLKEGKWLLDVDITRNELSIDNLKTDYRALFLRDDMTSFPYRLQDFEQGTFHLTMPLCKLKLENTKRLSLYEEKLGSFQFDFYFVKSSISDNKGESDESKYPYRIFPSSTRRSWLKRNAGVKIYRDKFRIRPYGENGDDWLHLGDRYSANPIGAGQRLGGYHIRQNQIVGAIEISRIDNPLLQDKSGREGLQENIVVDLFKDILLGIINLMEVDRNTVMYNLSQLYESTHPRGKAKKDADAAIQANKINRENYDKVKEGYKVLSQEVEERENELRLMRNLASTGLVITSFAHELRNIAILSKTRSEDIRAAIENVISEKEIEQKGLSIYENPFCLVNDLKDQDQNIRSWLEFAINSINRDKRTRTIFTLDTYFTHFDLTWRNVLKELNIELEITGFTPQMKIKAFTIDLDTIFNNMISNSIYAIKERKSITNRWIRIKGTVDLTDIHIYFEDTGTGLSEEYKATPSKIFNAFESSKRDEEGNKTGTGLGLYIAKTTLAEYKDSSISIYQPKEQGFGICVTFRKK